MTVLWKPVMWPAHWVCLSVLQWLSNTRMVTAQRQTLYNLYNDLFKLYLMVPHWIHSLFSIPICSSLHSLSQCNVLLEWWQTEQIFVLGLNSVNECNSVWTVVTVTHHMQNINNSLIAKRWEYCIYSCNCTSFTQTGWLLIMLWSSFCFHVPFQWFDGQIWFHAKNSLCLTLDSKLLQLLESWT